MGKELPAGYVIVESEDFIGGKYLLCIEGEESQPLLVCPEKSQAELFFEKLFSEAEYDLLWNNTVILFVTIPDVIRIETGGIHKTFFRKAASFESMGNNYYRFHTKNASHLGAHLGRLAFAYPEAQNILNLLGKFTPHGLEKRLHERQAIKAIKDQLIAAHSEAIAQKDRDIAYWNDCFNKMEQSERVAKLDAQARKAEILRLLDEAKATDADAKKHAAYAIAYWKELASNAEQSVKTLRETQARLMKESQEKAQVKESQAQPIFDGRVFTVEELREMPVGTTFIHATLGKGQVMDGCPKKMHFEKHPYSFGSNAHPWNEKMRLVVTQESLQGKWDIVQWPGYVEGAKYEYHAEITDGKFKFAPHGCTYDMKVNPDDSSFTWSMNDRPQYSGSYRLQGDELTLGYHCAGYQGDSKSRFVLKRREEPKHPMVGTWVRGGYNDLTITDNKATYGQNPTYDLWVDMSVAPFRFGYRQAGTAYSGLFKVEDEGKKLTLHYVYGIHAPKSFDQSNCNTEIYTRK